MSAVTPGRKMCVLYGCTEVEPISFIFAAEKMVLEASCLRGHCVGRPVFDGTARVIRIIGGGGCVCLCVCFLLCVCAVCLCCVHVLVSF